MVFSLVMLSYENDFDGVTKEIVVLVFTLVALGRLN
jgi:hypothetical protein